MKDQNILINNGIDLAKGLELFGDIDMYNESLGDFMGEVNEKLNKIASFRETKDMHNYAILVHSLKSDAKYFGFNKLAELAYSHELESKQNNIVFVNENYEALLTETKRIIEVVKQYLADGTHEVTPLPQAVPQAPQPVAPMPVAPQPAVEAPVEMPVVNNTDKQIILVVDDSDIITSFVSKSIEETYVAIVAKDGAEAINHINSNPNISAMLLDLNMPNVDGFKVLEYMKENDLFNRVPVSIVTGNDNRDVDHHAFEFPIVDILKKPFTTSSVLGIIERTINSRN